MRLWGVLAAMGVFLLSVGGQALAAYPEKDINGIIQWGAGVGRI